MESDVANTPAGAIQNALLQLSLAKKLLSADSSLRRLSSRIDAATQFLNLILKEIPQPKPDGADSNSSSDATPEPEPKVLEYTPQVIPVEELLNPISADNPAGENPLLSGKFNEVEKHLINRARASDFSPSWSDAYNTALELLKADSKSLALARRLIECGYREHGLPAISDGLILINGLLSNFWETLHPLAPDDDCEKRANELTLLSESLVTSINIKMGDVSSFNPNYATLKAATRDKLMVDSMLKEFDALHKYAYEHFDDEQPEMKDLGDKINIFHKKINAKFAALEKSEKEKKEAALNEGAKKLQQAAQADSSGAAAAPANAQAAAAQVSKIGEFMVQSSPQDPMGYMLNRAHRWFSANANSIPAVADARYRQKISQLYTAKNWQTLLAACETVFMRGGHTWLDLARYQIEAARALGEPYTMVSQVLSDALFAYVSADGGIIAAKLPDNAPAADNSTKEWIEKQLASRSGSGGGDGGDDAKFNHVISEAASIAAEGRLPEALSLFMEQVNSAASQREKFQWQLSLAEFGLGFNFPKNIIPMVEALIKQIEERNLENWEEADLMYRVFKAGHQAYSKAYGQRAPADKIESLFQKVCLYNPTHFLTSN